MTRSELIVALASRFPSLVARDAEIAVKEILEAIGSALTRGDRVEIRGFGSFWLELPSAPHRAQPQKRANWSMSPGRYVPHFKAGKEMRERVERASTPPPLRRAA